MSQSRHPESPRLIFLHGFDEREADEARARGYRSHVFAECADGMRYPLFFYDPVRLAQDLDSSVSCGIPYIAEPGMVVVPEVTLEFMQQAVQRLAAEGFFAMFKPSAPGSSEPGAIPPCGGK